MTKHLIDYICFVFILFASLSLKAQDVNERLSLSTVLDTLEVRYDITFTYADTTIREVRVNIPNPNLSLDETISFLNRNTDLKFTILNGNQVIIQAKSDTKKPIKVEFLDEVLITNYLTKGISLNNQGAIKIKQKEFGILPGLIEPDILQSIQALPGVSSIDETVSNLNIRGGTHDQNLILWDGIKMYQSGHFFGLISAFNPYLTNQVIITKNGTSAKFGDGVSSTIDMQLDDKLNETFSSGIGLNLIHVDGFAKIPLNEQLELQVSARRSISDLIETPTYNQYFERIFQDSDITNNQTEINNTVTTNEAFYFYDLSAKLLYDISKKGKIRLNFLTINNNLEYLEEATIDNIEESLSSGLTQFNLAGGIEYQRNWNNNFTSSLHIYASNYDLKATNFDFINDQRLIQENEVLDTAVKFHTVYNANSNLNWANGYQFNETGISNLQDVNNPLFRSYIKEVIRSHAAYSEVNYKSKDINTDFKAGVRVNYFEKFEEFIIEPRISFSQQFSNYFRFEVLGEFKSQTTSQIIDLQNDFLGIEKRRWVLANNENIPIIKSKQVSAGIHYKKNRLLINAEAYIKDVKGITTRSQGFQNQYQFVNAIGNYQVKGIDFLINKQFTNTSTWFSYSYSKNDYNFDTLNNGIYFPNNVDLRHSFTFAGTYTLNDLKFAIGVNWHSGKPTTNIQEDSAVVNNDINYKLPNNANLDDYFRTDFSTTYGFDLGPESKAKIGLSVWNLLNQKNTLNTYFKISDNNTINKIENRSLGITPNVNFRIDF